jgi:hypothetical protein
MFDRSACARVRVAANAHANFVALTTVVALLQQVLKDRFASSNALLSGVPSLSRDQNRGEVHATPEEAGATPRAQQIDLFAGEPRPATGNMPAWSGLPTKTRVTVTDLMTRLILAHADKSRIGSMTEVGRDL